MYENHICFLLHNNDGMIQTFIFIHRYFLLVYLVSIMMLIVGKHVELLQRAKAYKGV